MLWEAIIACFGITKAQERYNLLREICALKLDGSDYMGHQAKWLSLMADFDRLDVSIDDVKHNLSIQSLGQWQSRFVKTKLNEFFATGGGGAPIKNLDLGDLMRQLQNRAHIQTQTPKRNKDQQRSLEPKKGSSSSSSTSADKKSDLGSAVASRCSYCSKPGHQDPSCWLKYINRAPKDWVSANVALIRKIRQKNGNSIDIPGLERTSQAQAKRAAVSTQPLDDPIDCQSKMVWYFDTCASFHMTPHRKLFTTYTSLDSGDEIGTANGHCHVSIGVSNIDIQLNSASVTLPDVRHIPGLDLNLLSETQLHDDGFLIRKATTAPFHYELESANGCKFFAVRDPNNVYRITALGPAMAPSDVQSNPLRLLVGEAFTKKAFAKKALMSWPISTADLTIDLTSSSNEEALAKASTDIKSDFPKTLWEWHVALGHLNYDDVLYLARQPSSGIKIQGSKARPICHVCLEAKITQQYSYRKVSRAT